MPGKKVMVKDLLASGRGAHEPHHAEPGHTHYQDVDGILQIVKDGLCHRCGACVGVCPVGTFGLDDEGYPIQVDACINCNICVASCSGVSVDYPHIGQDLFGEDYQYGSLLGVVESSMVAHACDDKIRCLGASGGVVTALLVHLLETGQIKGALVAVEDPDDPCMGKGIIARSRDELLRSAQSRYTSTPSFAAMEDMQKDMGPYAVVGLPCQLHALRKRQLTDPRWRRRISLTIGIHCSVNPMASATRDLARVMGPRGVRPQHVFYRSSDNGHGWPYNALKIDYADGDHWHSPLNHPQTFNILTRIAPLGRCLTCLDHCAEFADLAIGDPWLRNERGEWKYNDRRGESLVLVRTEVGQRAMEEALSAGAITGIDVPPDEIVAGQRHVLEAKKKRVGLRIAFRKAFGKKYPYYPMPLPRADLATWKKEALYRIVRLVTIVPGLRMASIRFAFSRVGRGVLTYCTLRRKKKFTKGRLR